MLRFLKTSMIVSLACLLYFHSYAAIASEPTPTLKNALSTPYPAPLLIGISGWINSPPLKLSDFKNKVVLIEFWTSSCPYCKDALPHVNKWYSRYHEKGLLIIGVHSPKEEWESNSAIVRKAVATNNIHYPVAMDNNFETWNSYGVEGWPATYLIDQKGDVVYVNYGAADFDITENNIKALLGIH